MFGDVFSFIFVLLLALMVIWILFLFKRGTGYSGEPAPEKESVGVEDSENQVCLRLDGLDGFHRTYYKNVLLKRNTLRGAKPKEAVNMLKDTGVWILFKAGKVSIEALPNAPTVKLNDCIIKHEVQIELPFSSAKLEIGQLVLEATCIVPSPG